MMSSGGRRIAVCLLSMMVVATPALAVVVLDQELEPDLTNGGGMSYVGNANRFQFAQTFTVGIRGKLTSLDLLLLRHSAITDPLLVDVRTTLDGVPSLGDTGPHILSSAAVDAADIPGVIDPDLDDRFLAQFVHVDVPDVVVAPGEILAIVLRSNETVEGPASAYVWVGPSGAPWLPTYPNGTKYNKTNPLASWTVSTSDAAFRTYVRLVPEPKTVSLFAAVFGMLLPMRLSRVACHLR